MRGFTAPVTGIEEAAIARVLRDLQSAIRGELFRRVLLNGPREPA
jgi:hypothetical protein